jgi:hypothetical protein
VPAQTLVHSDAQLLAELVPLQRERPSPSLTFWTEWFSTAAAPSASLDNNYFHADMPLDTERGISRYLLQGFPRRRGNPTYSFLIVHLLINAHFSFAYCFRKKRMCIVPTCFLFFSAQLSSKHILEKFSCLKSETRKQIATDWHTKKKD